MNDDNTTQVKSVQETPAFFVIEYKNKKILTRNPNSYKDAVIVKTINPDINGVLVVDEDIEYIGKNTFSGNGIPVKKVIINTSSLIEFDVSAFINNKVIESIDINSLNGAIIKDSCFSGCDNLKTISVNRISDINYTNNSLDNVIVQIKKVTVSELLQNDIRNNYRFDSLIIDDLSDEGLSQLKTIFSKYNRFNHIYVGTFEVSTSIINYVNSISVPMIINNIINISFDARNILLYMDNIARFDDFNNNLLNDYNSEIFNKNVEFFRKLIGYGFLNIGGRDLFATSPLLFKIDFEEVFKNIDRIRDFCNVNDDDIKLCYFDDFDFIIDLDNKDSIKKYLADYITKNSRLPKAMNSLLINAELTDIVEFVDRLNYVITMNLSKDKRDEYLCKDSTDILYTVDNESFNSIFGDYRDRAYKYNKKIPFLRGIKTKVYEKLKGYIKQNVDENILFDRAFGPIVDDYTNAYIRDAMTNYFYNISSYVKSGSTKKDLEFMKNIICGRILHGIIKSIKEKTHIDSTEQAIRQYLTDFKTDPITKDIPSVLFKKLYDVIDSDTISTMLKIDPYSFDMLRNYSKTLDVPIKEQLDSILESGTNSISPAVLKRIAQTRFLVDSKRQISRNINNQKNELILGYDDIRYYRFAKASGYRFTKEEDKYYEEKISDFNSQLDEVINDPKYSAFSTQLKTYRIREVVDNVDITRVFFEFLQNEISPSNMPSNKRHDFEERVKELVDKFIADGCNDPVQLYRILYAIDMLYRNSNPAILRKYSNEIIDNPLLISNPNISDVQKVGVALIALNKMAHQQSTDFVLSDFLSKYRFNDPITAPKFLGDSVDVVGALNVLSKYSSIKDMYRLLFRGDDSNVLRDTSFYRYIDDGDGPYGYDKVILLGLTPSEATNLFNFVMKNANVFGKLLNKENPEGISPEIIKFYKEKTSYIWYIFKYLDNNKSNPLLISMKQRKEISKQFNSAKNHFYEDLECSSRKRISDSDYVRIFKSIRKIRQVFKEDPKLVEQLYENSLSQRNFYDLKAKFSIILLGMVLNKISHGNRSEIDSFIEKILNLTKEEKLELFREQGIFMEVKEDYLTPGQDILSVYTNSEVEPYSIHLTGKYINDKNREHNKNNTLITVALLDSRNPTPVDNGFTYDFTKTFIFFDKKFRAKGRANAILVNFLNIDIPALLGKYGISHDLIRNILNGNVNITRDNVYNYVDPRTIELLRNNGYTDEEIVNKIEGLIDGIKKMISHLKKNRELKIPDDMELDNEFEYLKKYRFTKIEPRFIPKIMSLIGNDIMKYDDSCRDCYISIVQRYNEILNDPKNPNYYGTLRGLLISLLTPKKEKLSNTVEENVYYFGDEDVTFKINSNKQVKILSKMNIVIDMEQLKNDVIYRNLVEEFVKRMSIRRAKRPNTDIEKVQLFNEIISGIANTGNYVCAKDKIAVYHLRKSFINFLLIELVGQRNIIVARMQSSKSTIKTNANNNPNAELTEMMGEVDTTPPSSPVLKRV